MSRRVNAEDAPIPVCCRVVAWHLILAEPLIDRTYEEERRVSPHHPDATYILPIRSSRIEPFNELTAYLRRLSEQIAIIVVDGSPPDVFAAHAAAWSAFATHVAPDPKLRASNGKVHGVLTGVALARGERLVIADDDVRYDVQALTRLLALLHEAAIVRPQNYFDPLPWHARWDTARTLLNRMLGGDWPGTLGVRRSVLQATGGYAGDVLFENLELVRTVRAAGGNEAIPLDLFVRRIPASTAHFWSQRVRQAYDEFARPLHLVVSLMVLPLTIALLLTRRWTALLGAVTALVGLAELGRRRGDGRRVFPASATLFAPIWVAERAICIWLALGSRLRHGGVRYRDGVLSSAATPAHVLRHRYQALRTLLQSGVLPLNAAEANADATQPATAESLVAHAVGAPASERAQLPQISVSKG